MHHLALLLLPPVAFPVLAGTAEVRTSRYVEVWNPPEAQQKLLHGRSVTHLVHRPPSAQTDARTRRLAEMAPMPSGSMTSTPGQKPANRAPTIPPMLGPDGGPFVV